MRHYKDSISTFKVGVAMSVFQFAGVIFTPIHAITISKMGRKNAMLVGEVCMFVANVGLGMLAIIPYDRPGTFYTLTLLIQGYGNTLTTTTALSLISTNFSEDKQKYIAYFEAAGGLGLMIGPPLGSFLYGIVDYAWTFYLLSLFIGLNGLISYLFIPDQLNRQNVINLDRNQLVSNFLYSVSFKSMSVYQRNNQVDSHNVKMILEHLDNDPENKKLIKKGVSLN
jgi:MFS family permease